MSIDPPFPLFAHGTVVHGFGRGSKELGCPTANFDESTVENLPITINQGVYYGWAQLQTPGLNQVYKMVTSIGTNPHYNGEKRTMETHILHEFPDDFYGERLKIVLLGEIRKMTSFKNLDELIAAIQSDIARSKQKLDEKENLQYQDDAFFRDSSSNESNHSRSEL